MSSCLVRSIAVLTTAVLGVAVWNSSAHSEGVILGISKNWVGSFDIDQFSSPPKVTSCYVYTKEPSNFELSITVDLGEPIMFQYILPNALKKDILRVERANNHGIVKTKFLFRVDDGAIHEANGSVGPGTIVGIGGEAIKFADNQKLISQMMTGKYLHIRLFTSYAQLFKAKHDPPKKTKSLMPGMVWRDVELGEHDFKIGLSSDSATYRPGKIGPGGFANIYLNTFAKCK